MSDAEFRRRKIARVVMKRAWLTFRKSFLSWKSCLRIAWKTIRFRHPVHYSKVYGTTYENRQNKLRLLQISCEKDIRLFFQREEDNVFDKNAIRIMAKVKDHQDIHIGYVSRDWAQIIAPSLDQGQEALVILSQITGDPTKGKYLGLNYEFIIFNPFS